MGGVRHHFFAQFGLHVLQLVALTTAHGFLVGIDSYTLPTTYEASLDLITFLLPLTVMSKGSG